jgi:hypothetical protein
MNPKFAITNTFTTEIVITPEIARLLVRCIKHAIETGTKDGAFPDVKLGDHGVALIKAIRNEYGLSLPDAMHNARRMVGTLDIKDLPPQHDWTADKAAAKRVLDYLRDENLLQNWVHTDLVERINTYCK